MNIFWLANLLFHPSGRLSSLSFHSYFSDRWLAAIVSRKTLRLKASSSDILPGSVTSFQAAKVPSTISPEGLTRSIVLLAFVKAPFCLNLQIKIRKPKYFQRPTSNPQAKLGALPTHQAQDSFSQEPGLLPHTCPPRLSASKWRLG